MNMLVLLTYVMPADGLRTYRAVVTAGLLLLIAFCLYLAFKDWKLYLFTGEKIHRTNALLWGAGAGMCLFTALFILLQQGWLMGIVYLIGTAIVFLNIGGGIRNQLNKY